MTALPRISIITPVKNGGETFERAIKSLIEQNYPNLEYIVMDGASTDNTLAIIEKYKNHITYSESKDDGNGVLAQIEGYKKATGEIFSLLNADDFYEPGTLLKVGETFTKDPSLDVVSMRFRTIRINDGKEEIIEESSATDMEISLNKLPHAPAPNARFYKINLLEKFGTQIAIDDKNRPFISNDVEFLIRLTLHGIKNKVVDHVAYNYLVHEGSLTFSTDNKTKKRLCEDKILIAKKFLKSPDLQLPPAYKKTFTKWLKKYRAKIVAINFAEKNWSELNHHLIKGINECGAISFPLQAIKEILRK